jgi:16S rRNA (uracil1498-N3)-methyltransferase
VEPAAAGTVGSLAGLRGEATPHDAALLVGPEGGWEDAECAVATAHGLRLVSLGARTLRADAVPIVALSILDFLWQP